MKANLKGFVLGVATTVAISTLGFTALAAGNLIEIHPINIMVNGQIFAPKDVNGKEVPVFTYEGTTYAPLRALGEAFGQKIGYDNEKNVATVGEVPVVPEKPIDGDYSDWTAEEEKAYQEFKGMWVVKNADRNTPQKLYLAIYDKSATREEMSDYFRNVDTSKLLRHTVRLLSEYEPSSEEVGLSYMYKTTNVPDEMFYQVVKDGELVRQGY